MFATKLSEFNESDDIACKVNHAMDQDSFERYFICASDDIAAYFPLIRGPTKAVASVLIDACVQKKSWIFDGLSERLRLNHCGDRLHDY